MIKKTMLSVGDDRFTSQPTIGSPSSATWFYLSFEFLVALGISGFVFFLSIVKSFLPKPPRDLTGDVVLVTGTRSQLGGLVAEEFARGGCSVICVDEDGQAAEETARRLRCRYPTAAAGRQRSGKHDGGSAAAVPSCAYRCDLWDREQIKALALRVKHEVGRVDVLVTCAGSPGQGIFDTVTHTLMSHYWTIMAFLPSMLHRERAHVIGITPTVSTEDAYMGSKAAVAGIMDSLGRTFNGRNNRLTFMTVAPRAEPSLLRQSEQEIAKEIVQAVQRDLPYLSMGWTSKLMYQVSCRLYGVITSITKWLDT